jgi:hypothetical protein
MDVIRHQAVRVHQASELPGKLAQVKKIEHVVTISSKANASIDAALDHVGGNVGNEKAERTRHGGSTPCRTGQLTVRGLTPISGL